MRNYRAGLAKWQTADPLGYPDGWNQLAYCRNGATEVLDFVGGFGIFPHDVNNSWKIVLNENVLVVKDGENKFEYRYIGFVDVGGEIFINMNVSLSVDSQMYHDYQLGHGAEASYKPHTGTNNDSISPLPVYEAVKAHELGHASSFFNYFLPHFRRALTLKDIDSYSGQDASIIEEAINECYVSVINDFLKDSNRTANSKTFLWFLNHRVWVYQGQNAQGFHIWIKE